MFKQQIENPIVRERSFPFPIYYPIPKPAVIAECTCGENVYAGDTAIHFDEEWYCNERCFCKHMGAVKKVAV